MRTTLLLISGTLGDASLWDGVLPGVQELADVRIALPWQESIPAMAAAAWEQVADLPPDAPLVLVGFSLGGYIAIEMLAKPARAVRAAALLSTSARPESAEAAATREKTIAALQRHFERTTDGIAQWCTHEAAPELLQRVHAMMLRVGPDVAVRQNRATMARADHRAALAALRIPVAVACGRQDRVTPLALSEELAALIPGATLQVADGCGHMLPCERPATVVQALRGLLA